MPVSSNKKKNRLWDGEQAKAYAGGVPAEEWPDLPTVDSPVDLLDDGDVADVLGISRSTWRSYKTLYAGTPNPRPEPDDTAGGTDHWYRKTIRGWMDRRPGEGAGAGRKAGSKLTAFRKDSAAHAHATTLVAMMEQAERDGTAVSRKDVEAAFGIEERAAQRLMRAAETLRERAGA